MREELPGLTATQVQECERLLLEEYGYEQVQVLELAGQGLAFVAKEMLDQELEDRPVVVLAGSGSKGSTGLVAARHLLNWGAWVQVLCSEAPDVYQGNVAKQLAILRTMDAPLAWAEDGWELPPCDLVIETILGAEANAKARGMARRLIELANSSTAPILSFDFPSGLDPTTGDLFDPHIRATATVAKALPRRSLLVAPGNGVCGDLYIIDIGAPPALFRHFDIDIPSIFAQGSVVRVEALEAGSRVAPL